MINHKFLKQAVERLSKCKVSIINSNRSLRFVSELIPYLYLSKAKTFNSSELLSGLQYPYAWCLLPYFVWYTPILQCKCNALVILFLSV
jgi:hypothetical protein